MTTRVRIVLADDHPITREGIKKFLINSVGIDLIGEAEDGEEALRMAEELSPDVLLLDMEMPKLKGLEVAKRLKEKHSPVRILALSTYDDKQYIYGVLATGASGYLTKEEVPENIVDAVRGVARGEQGWVSRRIAALMATWTHSPEEEPDLLTEREMEVLLQLAEGKTNKEIGYALDISQKTVEKHLESIYTKLNVNSRVEAAVFAVEQGYIKKGR
ncbi:MAG: DNA-binding response regulator [Anaerolineaceae bacterium]|nr:DNA-binding response regulator [Anaerolineaceae bacterium]